MVTVGSCAVPYQDAGEAINRKYEGRRNSCLVLLLPPPPAS